MSRLDELIAELCPDGVELKLLWEVTAWDKKFNGIDKSMQKKVISYPYLLAADLFALQQDFGDVFLLSTGSKTGWTREEFAKEYLCEGEVVAIPWGGTANVKYHNGKFVTADNRIATSLDTSVLSNKYLYYWMTNNLNLISSFYRGSGIKHPSMKDVLTMKIPLPPLPVQREIVRILDNFTELSNELSNELSARKKQYEYYRESLISSPQAPRVKLNEIAKITRGVRLVRSQLSQEGPFPVYQNSMIPLGYYHNSNTPGNTTFIISAGAAGEIGYSSKDFWAADDCLCITCTNELHSKYLYYALLCQQDYIFSRVRRASVPRLSRTVVEQLSIPLPSFMEQERIVSILDRFETLCNDITAGLPAEIEARRKQYEHYRDKLLTFQEA